MKLISSAVTYKMLRKKTMEIVCDRVLLIRRYHELTSAVFVLW